MAIYRSDQATVTFAPEAAQGAFPENANLTNAVDMSWGHKEVNAGDTTVSIVESGNVDNDQTFSVTSGANLKTFVVIGNNGKATATNTGPKEVRRIVAGYGTSTLTVDTPFGFHHAATTNAGNTEDSVHALNVTADGSADTIDDAGSGSIDDKGKYITWLPGVYESVDCPDPEQAFEPKYILGGLTNRSFYQMYAGQETLSGSMGGMVMLNGFPLRYGIGKVVTTPVSTPTDTQWNLNGAHKKGDTWLQISRSGATTIAKGTYLLLGVASGGTAPSGSSHQTDSSKVYEIVQVTTAVSSATNTRVNVWPPIKFDHPTLEDIYSVSHTAGTTEYLHTIFESVALPSMTWNVSILDDEGSNVWQRRYMGGKVGSMTLSAEQGGLLTGGWDGVNFLDMVHNVKTHPNMPANQPMPRYTAMQEITSSDVGRFDGSSSAFSRPNTSPYYFSQGIVKMFDSTTAASSGGTAIKEVARLLNMSLSINNTAEPRYYLGAQYDGRRAPREQFEGNREYSLSATMATDDSENNETSDTTNLFKELLLAGDYRTATGGFKGFGVQLKFIRDLSTLGSSTEKDYILIDIPADGTAALGGNEQGAFIRSATHNIGEDSPVQADADIAFRSMRVKIRDYEPIYP